MGLRDGLPGAVWVGLPNLGDDPCRGGHCIFWGVPSALGAGYSRLGVLKQVHDGPTLHLAMKRTPNFFAGAF